MRRTLLLAGLILAGPAGLTRGQAPPVDRGKAEAEAAGQAAEADRLFKLGEFGPALALFEAERASRAKLGDLRYEAYALRAIGICRGELGDDAGGIEAWTQARALDLQRDDPGYAGYDDLLIGQAELRLGRVEAALATLERAVPRLATAVDRDHEADAHLLAVRITLLLHRPEAAQAHADRALALANALKDDARIADAGASLGQVAVARGQPALALERFSAAQKSFDRLDRPGDAAWLETAIGSTLLLLGRPEEAIARYEAASRLHDHLDDLGALAEDLTAVAGLHLDAGRIAPAIAAATRAVDAAARADDRPREVDARVRLAQAQGEEGDWPGAAATLVEAVDLVRQVARDDPEAQVRLLLTAAEVNHRARLADATARSLDGAQRVADDARSDPLRQAVADARRRIAETPVPPEAPRPPG